MTQVDFSVEEKKLLEELVGKEISDLRTEISHTDVHEYKEGLKKRKQNLIRCLEKLQGAKDPSDYSVV